MSITTQKKLGFGAMRLPLSNSDDPKSIDLEQVKIMVDRYLERGFCYFDTAYPYHDGYSEEALRQCVVEPSPASLAIRYAASLEQVKVVLSGMSTPEQVDDNTAFMREFAPLSAGEHELAERIAAELKRSIRVPCTSCRYCMEVCPQNIAIPDYFGLLNLHAVTGKKTNMYYERYSMNHGKASECLKCGLCEKNCPQHIAIRDMLEEFAALYEA